METSTSRPPDLSAQLPKLVPRRKKESAEVPPQQAQQQSSQPVPETPALSAPPPLREGEWTFTSPKRRILSPRDHELFLNSPTYTLLQAFVFGLSDSVRNTPISAVDEQRQHPTVQATLRILDEAEQVVNASPPADQGGSRFGNIGFRRFLDGIGEQAERWHQDILGVSSGPAAHECSVYLLQAFGNRTRIDYGSGHELNFIVWLLCLYQLGNLTAETFPQVVLVVFARYLSVMRRIQSTYYLEPAGSHGVWGLDDYQFLPFLFGASQLYNHAYIRPRSIHQQLVLEEAAADYLYLGQVDFVNSVKNVDGLRWHSPMLDDISSAKSWAKIEAGMKRMFLAEVLGKLPVMQHFMFGSLVPATEGMSERKEEEPEDGHTHDHTNAWGDDCCGIKVPSSVGAAGEDAAKQGQLRRIPFD